MLTHEHPQFGVIGLDASGLLAHGLRTPMETGHMVLAESVIQRRRLTERGASEHRTAGIGPAAATCPPGQHFWPSVFGVVIGSDDQDEGGQEGHLMETAYTHIWLKTGMVSRRSEGERGGITPCTTASRRR